MRLVWGIVRAVTEEGEDRQRLEVALDDRSAGSAIAYPKLSGPCRVSDRVLLNTTAVDLGLGTGGVHFVVARVGDGGGVILDEPSGGHILKLRYTPLQVDVLTVEEQDSPYHEIMRDADSLGGMPVACCGLHSQVPLVAAAVKRVDPELKVAFVMTDDAALPIALSGIARQSCEVGLLDATITSGHAFGGQYEAVTLHSALLAARHVVRADVAVVAIGPGVVGTATPFGHGGIAQGEALNAVAALKGEAVAVLRASLADARPRHHGVSHHSLSALTRIATAECIVAVPTLPDDLAEQFDDTLEDAGVWERHVRVVSGIGTEKGPSTRGVEVRTMGRGIAEDPVFFACAYAAGDVCAHLAHGVQYRDDSREGRWQI
ncbi:MAG: DUF3866 family protein [Coriobacteriia bacterium]|nr:DUF3866 family protein [Coriobacteriia bacterium]